MTSCLPTCRTTRGSANATMMAGFQGHLALFYSSDVQMSNILLYDNAEDILKSSQLI